MALNSTRDPYALTRQDLLADYAAISRRRPGAASATSLRIRSREYLEILAHEASDGRIDWEQLRAALSNPDCLAQLKLRPVPVAAIGRTLVLRPQEPDDMNLGMNALARATGGMRTNQSSREFRKLLVDCLIIDGRDSEARELLDRWPDVDRQQRGYLRTELDNPSRPSGGDRSRWLEEFNRAFTDEGFAAVGLQDQGVRLFDRLKAGSAPRAPKWVAHPLVTVVMTVHDPDIDALNTSVRSVLGQTVEDLELIIVDDASAPNLGSRILRWEYEDPRVRVVRLEENGGTYRARNVGFELARGEFVTGQDDDDWSHPGRLEEQIRLLREDSDAVGCRVMALACLEDLSRVRVGRLPEMANASTLMVRKSTFESLGGFLEIRKAADTEFVLRLQKMTGRPVVDIPKVLTIVRITQDSLSRADFGPGWRHPSRRAFRHSYLHWHDETTSSGLRVEPGQRTPVHVPRRFRLDGQFVERLDVVLAGDWRQWGGPQESMREEIRALKQAGFRVGVMHMEAPRFMSKQDKQIAAPIQQLINDGSVEFVQYDDPVRVDLLVLRYPLLLQFALDERSALDVERMVILANQAPSERDGSDVRYLVPDCTENAKRMFTENVVWAPQGAQVRKAISPYLSAEQLTPFDIPGVVDPARWYSTHSTRRSELPVVGRHSRDNPMKWPESARVLESAYPVDGSVDVRIMGGAEAPMEVLGDRVPPAAWTVYPTNHMSVPEFLRTLDYFVFYQNSVAFEAFGRAILEAVASGLVVILPPHFEEVFGSGAVYAEPEEVQGIVAHFESDRSKYAEQVEHAQRVVQEQFSYDAHVRRIRELMKGISA